MSYMDYILLLSDGKCFFWIAIGLNGVMAYELLSTQNEVDDDDNTNFLLLCLDFPFFSLFLIQYGTYVHSTVECFLVWLYLFFFFVRCIRKCFW